MFYMHEGTAYNLAQFDHFYASLNIVYLSRGACDFVKIELAESDEAKALVDDMWNACKPNKVVINNVYDECEDK